MKQSASLTFKERIQYLTVLMVEFKARCDGLIKGTSLDTVVGNPKDALKTSRENFDTNADRQRSLVIGRESNRDKNRMSSHTKALRSC